MTIEGYKRVKNQKPSRFSLQNMLRCLEDPENPSAGPYLRFINLTGNWHPNMELKFTRFKQLVFYIVMTLFFSHYLKCVIGLNLDDLLFILQTAPFHMGTPKSIFFRKYHHLWQKMIDYMSRTELKQLSDEDEEVINVMNEYIRRSRRVLYPFWLMAICCNISLFTEPYQKHQIVENGTDIYVPLFHFYLPFNQDVPPGYYYSMFIQTIIGNIMSSYVISWDSLVISTFIFFAGQLKISRVYCTRIIDPESKERSHENIVACHRFHTSLIEHQKLFQKLISHVMFIYLIVVSINIGSCIIQISNASGDLPVMMGAMVFVLGILTQLLMFYWFSNQVTVESLTVSSGIFESKWITADAKIQKEVALLQHTMSKRLCFRAGPCNEMSLNTFIQILKTSYSFFTLLKETK
ncbi:odorant receptor 49b-like [Leguminivora glycinivorella]|uniref:odorant receptor 49b-like n=1 Tax=Leguminivora glycinivorella TaxID=1035111 RepID=UPI00200DC912|nr:odorant receptor 49b-like [Leguminivora glycinivorella]